MIQVELRRELASQPEPLATRMNQPADKEVPDVPPADDLQARGVVTEPSQAAQDRPRRCPTCLEIWLSDESHPDPCPAPITCYNCRLPGHPAKQCPQLTTPGYPEPCLRPPYCYNCLKPGHTVGTCPDLSANDSEKPVEAPASRRVTRNQRRRSARLGPRALRLMRQAPCVPPQHPLTLGPLATLN